MFPLAIMMMLEDDDRSYMENLYRTHYRLMYLMARKYVRDQYGVEEVISDACVALIKNIATLRTLEDPQVQAYIVSTIRNRAFDYFDRQNAKNRRYTSLEEIAFGVSDGMADIEKHILLQEELDLVSAAIDALPAKERLVFLLKYQQDMDYRLIGKYAGIAEASVHKYLSRARSKVRAAVYGKEDKT